MVKSKMMIIIFPRKKKMTKEQLIRQTAVTSIMSLVSIGGVINKPRGGGFDLRFPLSSDVSGTGIPQNWFTGDSHFHVEVKRILNEADYKSLYHWLKQKNIPVFQGEDDGEPTMMVIGPYWADTIDEIVSLAIPLKKVVRPFSTDK